MVNLLIISEWSPLEFSRELAFSYYLNLVIKLDTVVSHIYFGSKYHAKSKYASKIIQLVTIINLFPFLKLYKDAKITNLVYYKKTRVPHRLLRG